MNTPLSFTVTVTGCKNCPYTDFDTSYGKWFCTAENPHEHNRFQLFDANCDQLTNSCPMIIKQKEESK